MFYFWSLTVIQIELFVIIILLSNFKRLAVSDAVQLRDELAQERTRREAMEADKDEWVKSREHYYHLWIQATDERDEMRKERDEFEQQLATSQEALKDMEKRYEQRYDEIFKEWKACRDALSGNYTDPDPLPGPPPLAVQTVTLYGMVSGIIRERDKLKEALRVVLGDTNTLREIVKALHSTCQRYHRPAIPVEALEQVLATLNAAPGVKE